MDWDFAIERNRGMLLGVVAGLFAMIGLSAEEAVERLSRPLYRKVHGLLRSAESAVRRLIIVMARDIVVEPKPRRQRPPRPVTARRSKSKSRDEREGRPATFNLFEPQRRSDAGKRRRRRKSNVEPRIHVFGHDPRIPEPLRSLFLPRVPASAPAPQPDQSVKDNTVSARRLCRRLFAIVHALKNLQREAERYALWQSRPIEKRRPPRERALRFGWPPGWRIRPTHEVHEILKDCHWLVRSLPEPDTS